MFSFKYKMFVATKAAVVLLSLAAAQWLSFFSSCTFIRTWQPPALGVQDLNPP
jgi:hypothetical protein